MKKLTLILLVGVLVVAIMAMAIAATTLAQGGGSFSTSLSGYEEVPAISTNGTGMFRATVNADGTLIDYELSYSGLSNTVAAHIHLGQKGVNGGVSAFLCGGGDKPACPAMEGTVTGTIDAADVIGPNGQGIAPTQIRELVAAMNAGVTYVNVHTNDGVDPANTGPGDFPGGEIRGQLD
ncbi:MAG TPA: CHRD domain-containing protein [Promineifilum sp.]